MDLELPQKTASELLCAQNTSCLLSSGRGSAQETHRTCGDNLGFSNSRRKAYSRPSKAAEKTATEVALPGLCFNDGQKKPEEASQRSTSLKSINIESIQKAAEKATEGILPELCLGVGENLPIPLCGQEDAGSRKKQEEARLKSQGHGSSSLKATRTKTIRKVHAKKFYQKGELLGRGGFGSVFAGTRKSDGLPVALKYAKKLDNDDILLPGLDGPMPREVGLLKTVNSTTSHPNVLQLYDWFDRQSSYVMAMERPVPCQDLSVYCEEQGGTLPENQARNVTHQLLGALKHCHQHRVVHRDVKPENVLIQTDTQQIKLIDFGCGDPLQETPFTEFSGTKSYQPPEWFEKEEFLAGPGTVWSVGVTLYQIACGTLPFKLFDSEAMQQVHFPEGLSPGIRDFISCCLSPRAEDRPTLEQLQLHPWLQQLC